MNWRRAWEGTVQLFYLLALFLGALFCLSVPSLDFVRFQLSDIFLNHPEKIKVWGWGLLGIVFGLGWISYRLHSRSVMRLQMHTGTSQPHISLDLPLMQKVLSHHLKAAWPKLRLPVELELRKKSPLELGLVVPFMSKEELNHWVEKAEPTLAPVLREKLGYQGPFIVRVEMSPK